MMGSPGLHGIENTARADKRSLIWSANVLIILLSFLVGRQTAVFGKSYAALSSTVFVSLSVLMAGSLIAAAIMAIYRQKAYKNLLEELDKTDQAITRADATAAHFRRLKTQINQQKIVT